MLPQGVVSGVHLNRYCAILRHRANRISMTYRSLSVLSTNLETGGEVVFSKGELAA